MSFTTWTPAAVSSEARRWSGSVWRMVESQHIAATMKLVDTREEQDLLETLLESGKPALPTDTEGLDYLLATPFRYPPRTGGSRFRGATDPGVFYGAESVRTAAAELGYWRWRFLQDAVDLEGLDPVPHTAFAASVSAQAVDLRKPPFETDAKLWQHPTHYAPTQAFARVVRKAGVGGIVYRSVRDPSPAWCIAVLSPAGFDGRHAMPGAQTWYLAVSQRAVTWRRESEAITFSVESWREDRHGSPR